MPQLFDQANRGELLELLQDLKTYINSSKPKNDDFTFFTDLVKTQQEQITQLQQTRTRIQDRAETGNSVAVNTDGRLQAQELFWQSRIKTLEETFAKSLRESEEKLENAKAETDSIKKWKCLSHNSD